MNTTFEQSISFAMTSAIIAALASLCVEHNNDIQLFCKMLQIIFPSKEFEYLFPDAQTLSNVAVNFKTTSSPNLASKGLHKKWNQVNFSYFNPHLNTKVHSINEVVLVEKNVVMTYNI